MKPRTFASIAAVVGGVGWLVKVGLIWTNGGTNTDTGVVGVLYVVGLVALVLALAAAGYALVARAPVWLRAVVTVATPLLVLMVWQLLDQAVKAVYTADTWVREEISVALTGAVALVLGIWGLARRRSADGPDEAAEQRPVRGRRAAR